MLRQRIITALILAAALLTILFVLPPAVAVGVFAVMMLMGAWEWAALSGLHAPAGRAVFTAAVAAAMAVLGVYAPLGEIPAVLLWVQLALWVAAAGLLFRFPAPIPGILSAPAGLAVLSLAWLGLAFVLTHEGLGAQWVLFLFVIVACADVGAFAAGKLFGRVKLAPRVSPGKTWEGLIGGLTAVGLGAAAGAWWFQLPVAALVGLCLAVAGISVVGDLSVSMLKRNAGLKDSGSLFPGHGGVLDRIDSLLAATPLFVIGLKWLTQA